MVICICAFLVFTNIRMFQKRNQLNRQISDLKTKIENLKNSNSNLQEGISKSNDTAYIEKVAREELDLQKPGEKVFSFVKTPASQQDNSSEKNPWPAWLAWVIEWFKK